MNDTLIVTVDGKPRTLLMSFNLAVALTTSIGSRDNIPFLMADPKIMADYMRALLVNRNDKGDPEESGALNISATDAVKALEWSLGHLNDFFLSWDETVSKRVIQMSESYKKIQDTITENTPT